jgi:hypothetical protein
VLALIKMKQTLLLILISFITVESLSAQSKENHLDDRLASTFEVFNAADYELAAYLVPFIEKRFIKELDSASFNYKFKKLDKYIGIKFSSDSLIKIYSWSNRNNGCGIISSTIVQFKTSTNQIKTVNFQEIDSIVDPALNLKDIHTIQINNKPHYLITWYGGHCGNHTYEIARVYKIVNENLVRCENIFENDYQIEVGTHRSGKIKMQYSPKNKILSYFHYNFNEDTGFYDYKRSSLIKWKLTRKGFKKALKL